MPQGLRLIVVFMLCSAASVAQQTLQNGLIMNYRLDANLLDASVIGNHATAFNGSWSQDRCGQPNAAANLSSNSHFSFPFNAATQVQPPLTIHFYAKFNSFSNPLAYYLFSTNVANASVSGYHGAILSFYQNVLYFSLGNGVSFTSSGRRTFQGSFTPNLNQWYEFFIVVSSVSSCQIYIDCAPLSITQTGTSISSINYFQNGGSLGRQWTSGQGFEYFNGSIDNFRMWNRALTTSERLGICASDTNLYAGVSCDPISVNGQNFVPPIDTTFPQGTCTSDFVRIHYQIPASDTVVTNQTACPGEVITFFGQNLQAPTTAYHSNNCDTVFQLNLTLGNCSDTVTIRDTLCPGTSFPFQGSAFQAPLDSFLIAQAGDTIYHLILSAWPDPVELSVNWTGCIGDVVDTLGLTLIVPFNTNYNIGICDTVLNLIGDVGSSCVTNCIAFVPNTFTPNGDGINDALSYTIPINAELFSNRIFNRWGQMIFETRDRTEFWDGTWEGNPAPDGVYYLRIQYTCNKENKEFVGFVTLLR